MDIDTYVKAAFALCLQASQAQSQLDDVSSRDDMGHHRRTGHILITISTHLLRNDYVDIVTHAFLLVPCYLDSV